MFKPLNVDLLVGVHNWCIPYRLNYSVGTQGIRNINYPRTTQGMCVTSDISIPPQLLQNYSLWKIKVEIEFLAESSSRNI